MELLTGQDGLLAARIVSSLFKQDDVPYRLVPVGGYSELEAKRDEALASEEVSGNTFEHQLTSVAYTYSAIARLTSQLVRLL